MSDRAPKRKGPFGLSPLTLFAAACLLVIVGMSGGIILDLMLRPDQPVRNAAVSHHAPSTVIKTPEEVPTADERVPSVLARPPATAPAPRPIVVPEVPAPPMKPDAATSPLPPAPEVALKAPVTGPVPSGKEKHAVTASAMPAAGGIGPAIAIVIDDMGLDRVHTAEALDLPAGVTVSIMTYATDVAALAARAHAGGHEILAHIPMQPQNGREDPGPHALTVGMDSDAIRATLATDLDSWGGYVGVNNHMGSRFTVDRTRMATVMTELKARGLFWLDSRTTTESAGPGAAEGAGVPYVTRDIFLDNVDTVAAVIAELERTIAIAKMRGTAIAIGHPHAHTIDALKQILPMLAERGVTLVPVTEILKRQQAGTRPS